MIEKTLKYVNNFIDYSISLKNNFKLKKSNSSENTCLIAKETLIQNEKNLDEYSKLNKEHSINFLKQTKCISLKSPLKTSNVNISENSKDQEKIYKLLRGNYEKINALIFDINYFKSLVFKENPQLFAEGKAVLKILFKDVFDCLTSSEHNEIETLHFNIIIGELLSLFPYLKPDPDKDEISVPIFINDEWKFVEYTAEEISFIPEKMPAMFIAPLLGSPIVAYGLIPLDNDYKIMAPPLLLFKGTTFPTDKGFSLSIIADFFPFTSVGTFAFWLGEDAIQKWLFKSTTYQRALVFGKSLGGSLAFKTTLTFHNLVSRAKKYGGPGCSKKELQKIQELSQQEQSPQFDRIIQKNDPVPQVDWIPIADNVNHYIVVSEKERTGFCAHADIYSTHEYSGFYLDEPTENDQYDWERYKMTLLRDISSIILFPILVTLHLIFSVVLGGLFQFFQKKNDELTAECLVD